MIWLIFVSFFASLLSGLTGLAGGAILMAVLSFFMPITDAIAVHAAIQVFSNALRLFLFRHHVNWVIFMGYVLLTVPGVFLATSILLAVPEEAIELLIGVLILASLPKRPIPTTANVSSKSSQALTFSVLGFFSSFVSMIAGTVGPLIAPFFLRAGLKKESFIATKAACQMGVQLTKLVFFSVSLDFAYHQHLNLLAALIIAVSAGTFTAKVLMPHISAGSFLLAIKSLLILLATEMILSAGWHFFTARPI